MAPATAAVVAVLGDDLLREVLLRLPSPADLLRAVLACKAFLRAARNAAFLRRFRRHHRSACTVFLGCLLLRDRRTPCLYHSISHGTLPGFVRGGDFSFAFLPGGGWPGASWPWELLDCRNGRLLLKNRGTQELAVADPVNRRCISLPAPPADRPVGFGLVADDGDSTFLVACISRDGGSSQLRALTLSSSELSWADVGGLSCEPSLAGSRAMQADRSLYWALEGAERMVVLNTARMSFSFLKLPPCLQQLRYDFTEKQGEDGGALHLLAVRGFVLEVWARANDGAGGLTWTQVKKSGRLSLDTVRVSEEEDWYQLRIIGVAAGIVLLRQGGYMFTIGMETMKIQWMNHQKVSPVLSHPYTCFHLYSVAWPPFLFNPTGQEDDGKRSKLD